MKKKILLELDPAVHKTLKKIAQDNAARFKPYAEMILRQHAENHLRQKLKDAQQKDQSHTQRLG